MAYFKGSPYIWSDGTHLHLWSDDGLDDWQSMEAYVDLPDASGVQIDETVMDQFAVMRVAELLENGTLLSVIEQALANMNFGANALRGCEAVLRSLAVTPR